jgi:cephalosporin-C deacetylase
VSTSSQSGTEPASDPRRPAKYPTPEPPDGFASFWSGRYDRAREVDPAPAILATRSVGERLLHEIEFSSTDGIRLGGWLEVPADGRAERGLVLGHGYGGRTGLTDEMPVARAAVLAFCSRGLPTRGLVDGIPSAGHQHVLHGIDDRDTYVHGGCVADLWCAVSALDALVPGLPRIDYLGKSFGGGIGALALPWDERIAAGCLVVPSFGNHPVRLTIPSRGSGEAVRTYAARHPGVIDVLRWFDAATATAFAQLPLHVAVALDDPAVAPAGQFAVADALHGPQHERFVLSAGHQPYATEEHERRALLDDQRAFLAG